MKASHIISLTTDFGIEDGYVGIIHGVILGINPQAKIVDMTHNVPRHNVDAGAFILFTSYKYFPEGTIHVVIIDPGVGSDRKAIVVETDKYYFVAPDNQVLKYIFNTEKKFRVFEISNQIYLQKEISRSFHGRDIFAPCAAYLSLGVLINEFGAQLHQFNSGSIILPQILKDGIKGQVIYSDSFGNLITNIHHTLISRRTFKIKVGAFMINGLCQSYSEGSFSEPIALISSAGYLEISINQKSAANALNLKPGA